MSDVAQFDRSLAERVLKAAQAELQRRKHAELARFTKWRGDIVGFVENVLLGFLWSKQKEICKSVIEHRRTAVPSCHDVGKSAIAARIAAYWIAAHPPGEAFVVTLAPTFHQVRGILWREINRLHAAGGLPGETNQTEWWLGKELVAIGRSPKDTDPTAIQGYHAVYVLVIFDEAGGISKELWDAADSLIANDNCRFLAIGNPDDPATEFAEVCKPGSGWNVITLDAYESPNFTQEKIPDWLRPLLIGHTWVQERIRKWGRDSPIFQSKIRGKFPEQSSDALIPLSALTAATKRGLELEDIGTGEPNELGCDVARFGGDKSVIFHRRGQVARLLERLSKRDTMHVAARLRHWLTETGATSVKIDDIGLGGGVTDRLNEDQAKGIIPDRVQIVPINVGESPVSNFMEDKFQNLRAEVNWDMRERFIENRITLFSNEDGDLDDLLSQASQVKYKFQGSVFMLEKKADMKKRTKGVSPDDWDGLVLCFAQPKTGAEAWITHYGAKAAEAQAAPPVKPETNRPWRDDKGEKPKPNELNEIYAQTVRGARETQTFCKRCGNLIPAGGTKITDGLDSWHRECYP